MLRLRTDAWLERKENVHYQDTSAMLTQLKKQEEFAWLNEVSSVPIQQALRHLQTGFNRFWTKKNGYPIFKKKGGKQAAEYTTSGFSWDGEELKIAKMKKIPLDIRWSRKIPKAATPTTVTITKDCAGRYFVSFLCDDCISNKPKTVGEIGIDLGLTHFAVLSSGEKVASPKIFRKHEKRLARAQRRFFKKKLGSENRKKAKLAVAKIFAKITDSRKDFLHKLSTRLINENQVIAVESLTVKGLLKNRRSAKSISDAGWATFVRHLEYKSKWYGRTFVGIDKWYPSTKRCHSCGYVMDKLELKIREWRCPECGAVHDRDINAAKNVLAAGLAVSVCGEDVRPILV